MATGINDHLGIIDADLEALLKTLSQDVIPSTDWNVNRDLHIQGKRRYNQIHGPDANEFNESALQIPVRDNSTIPVKVYTSKSAPATGLPLAVWLHGGGFCIGGLESDELNCRRIAKDFGAVVVNVDYRLAPEHPFPTSINDSWDAVKWAAANASKINADPTKGFIVGGTSAGGNMSAVIGHLARDEKLSPPLTGLCLLIPAITDYRVIPEKYKAVITSYEQNKAAPVLGLPQIERFMGGYQPDLKSTLYNIFAEPHNLDGLPPTAFQICGLDPLRDEALLYEKLLREEHNTKTLLKVYPGLPHAFWTVYPTLAASPKFIEDTMDCVKWLLEQGGK